MLQREGNYFVTENDEMAARGRIVTEYGELTKHMATLQEEARVLGEQMVKLGHSLAEGILVRPGGLSFLDRQKVENLISDLWKTNETRNILRQRIKELGLEL